MFTYKCEIQSGPMLEIKYYQSLRKRNKKNMSRSINRAITSEKMAQANRIRGEQHTQRLILANFKQGDWWVRFSAPYKNFTEEEFEKIVSNFFKRIKYHAKKQGVQFKYIGFCECGKRGGNWHLHIIIEDCIKDIALKMWKWSNGINLTPLYEDGNFADLAKYIRKDVTGTKRLKTSRNLTKPTVTVIEGKKREFKKLEKGEALPIPQGYYLVRDDVWVNDFTGANYHFVFMQLRMNHKRYAVEYTKEAKNESKTN
ncbi:hypothetical protein [Ruminococcus sp.]|uniref:rolling circle replication-associated protein n=1 Tax=Ruminococcus sp. TaxID=41978 RepID=UPI00307A97D9